jgi:hypothetical protein
VRVAHRRRPRLVEHHAPLGARLSYHSIAWHSMA